MKEHFLPVITGTLIIVCAGVIGYYYLKPHTKEYLENQIPSIVIRDVGITAEVAKTEDELVRGLGGRKELGEKDGMLFQFNKADYHGIWMKDMLFPIDIIWIGDDLTIVDITESVTPDTYPKIFEPKQPARMALEVNARFAAVYRIKVGDTLRMNESLVPTDIAGSLKK
jgi:uncharacterized protein